MQETIVRLYNYFHNKIYQSHSNISYVTHKVMIDNFMKRLGDVLPSIGINYLIQFFAYSFSYRESHDTERRITLNWIIGKKSLARWFEKPESYSWRYSDFLLEYNIDLERLRNDLIEKDIIANKLDPLEEREKSRMSTSLGTSEAQLYNCLLHTTLYNHRSVICLTCQFKTVCRKMLKEKYPRLYKQRGYAEIK